MTVHVFAGPTITPDQITEIVPAAQTHPPVAHGDLLRLGCSPGDVVVIIDGYYHQAAPVRHKEILHLLSLGVHVMGGASMGALRASELHELGMIGWGRVFDMYANGDIDADDEVAVAHTTSDDYRATNTPLVNIRVALDEAVRAGVVSSTEAAEVLTAARDLHYTERSWRSVRRRHVAATGGDGSTHDRIDHFLGQHPHHANAKHHDAVGLLRMVAEVAAGELPTLTEQSWRNQRVYSWLVEFTGSSVAGEWVSDANVLRYHQLYNEDFPRVWEELVLARMHAWSSNHRPGDHHAGLDLSLRDVTSGDGWRALLTDAERSSLPDDVARRRAVVRAFRSARGLFDLREHAPHLLDSSEAKERVAHARAVNDRVTWRGRGRLVDRLPERVLEQRLMQLWGVERDAGDDALAAAARDRGFDSVAAARSAVRTHYLADQERDGAKRLSRWSVDAP